MVRLKKTDSDTCAICYCPSNGILRFGVSACRACAAFFRRSLVANRTYRCRFGGGCSIGKDVRCICRACRLEKCKKMGMDLSKGQKYCGLVWPQESGDHENSITDSDERVSPAEISDLSSRTSKVELSKIKSLSSGRFIHNCNVSGGRVRGLLSKCSNGSSNSGYPSASFTDTQKQLALSSNPSEPCSSKALVNWSPANPTTSGCPEQSSLDFVPVMSSSWQADFQCRNKYPEANISSSIFMNPETIFSQRLRIPDLRSNLSSRHLQQIRLTTSEETPLIWEMLKGYRKFLCFRKTEELIEGTCTDNFIALRKDFPLISIMINDHFYPLDNFSVDAKWSLIWSFLCPFAVADCTYASVKYFPGKDDTRFMVSGRHYADYRQLYKYFNVKESKTDPNRMAEIYRPLYLNVFIMMTQPFRNMNITEEELVGFMGLCFWNDTVDSLSDREDLILQETKMALHNELYLVCQRAAGGDTTQGMIRFATLCNMVTFAHRFYREVSACISLVNASNLAFEADTLHNPHAF